MYRTCIQMRLRYNYKSFFFDSLAQIELLMFKNNKMSIRQHLYKNKNDHASLQIKLDRENSNRSGFTESHAPGRESEEVTHAFMQINKD